MIKSTYNHGFQLTFENGLTISVQFGSGNYCDRCSFNLVFDSEMQTNIVKSENAEIAIWDQNNNWFNFGNDTVKGWVKPDEIADWIWKVKNANSIKTII